MTLGATGLFLVHFEQSSQFVIGKLNEAFHVASDGLTVLNSQVFSFMIVNIWKGSEDPNQSFSCFFTGSSFLLKKSPISTSGTCQQTPFQRCSSFTVQLTSSLMPISTQPPRRICSFFQWGPTLRTMIL